MAHPPGKHVETPLEPVEVEPGAYDAAAMARGEPGVPRRFTWRGERFEVVAILDSTREVGPCSSGSRERYVRRHVTRARTADGSVVTLSGERGGRAGGPRWLLRRIERGSASG
jgi:hypothetical protein